MLYIEPWKCGQREYREHGACCVVRALYKNCQGCRAGIPENKHMISKETEAKSCGVGLAGLINWSNEASLSDMVRERQRGK